MSKKTSGKKTKTSGGTTTKRAPRGKGLGLKAGSAKGKHLVIVESPSKAKTINKYLGPDYLVVASVGHVRDLPTKTPKGDKSPVPGVDLEAGFKPSYQVLEGKEAVVRDLRRAATESRKSGCDIWFATDLDREGEAIAWHLANILEIDPEQAKRVMFAAITKSEIQRAFSNPHEIDVDKVNAQQARRILDRIVGFQVSPLLWKKVARGLSAGRVQSVAMRLVVEREREIKAFIPEENWNFTGVFAPESAGAPAPLADAWAAFLAQRDEKGASPTQKSQQSWLGKNSLVRAELVSLDGEPVSITTPEEADLTSQVQKVIERTGGEVTDIQTIEDENGKGPARFRRTVTCTISPDVPYSVESIETKRTSSRPSAPFITSTLQQAASSRLSFNAKRTMRTAQSLYEGVEIPGEGPVGLITYMRTDSTHLSGDAIEMARGYIEREYGSDYLPAKPNFFSSTNKAAQEAHEAIRPTSLDYPPSRVRNALKPDQLKLYTLIWERFVACQMTPAQWDATTVIIAGGPTKAARFKATGRILVFDGFYKVTGVPTGGDAAVLPPLAEGHAVSPLDLDALQKFTSPPARYTEASLIKMLESEGIGRPSTYADIIGKIQDRNYVEQIERRFYATDLGEVVTDKLIEGFPRIMDIGYTRQMEAELDKIEEEHLDWVEMLGGFYARFSENLERAHEEMQHAKAEVVPAPDEYRCETCGSGLVYRFGKNGRFLSCSQYPDCKYACPVDREGRPRKAEFVNVRCPKTGRPMVKRTGRFGPFVTTHLEEGEDQSVGMILNIDKKGFVTAPSPPPLETDLPCPTCESPLNLRNGVRGPWLGCSRFPKCRGRGKWKEIPDKERESLEAKLEAHEKQHPIPTIRTLDGRALTDDKGKPLPDAPRLDELIIDDPSQVTENAA